MFPVILSDSTPLKASNPTNVTEEGRDISANEVHSENEWSPIDVTEDGIVTCFNAKQLRKAYLPIDVTEGGIVKFVSNIHFSKAWLLIELRDDFINEIFLSDEQNLKALPPIVATDDGIVISASDSHL